MFLPELFKVLLPHSTAAFAWHKENALYLGSLYFYKVNGKY
jgi:hypothetical protein